MKLLDRLFRPEAAASYELSHVLDHVPLGASNDDWRKARIVEAAQKHGKPFKCAGADVPHEVLSRSG
jgi:hypothetical protein